MLNPVKLIFDDDEINPWLVKVVKFTNWFAFVAEIVEVGRTELNVANPENIVVLVDEPIFNEPVVKVLNKLIFPVKLFGDWIFIVDADVKFNVELKISQLVALSNKLSLTAPTYALVFNLIVPFVVGFSIVKYCIAGIG